MTEPFLGQLMLSAFNFPPKGYALCNGALLPINQNQALFALLGTMYGGNGQTTFALPNLQGRVALHAGGGITQGEAGGATSVTLTTQQAPAHNHGLGVSGSAGNTPAPTNSVLASTPNQLYQDAAPTVTMSDGTIGTTGGSQAHPNVQPYTVISYCIALQGIFPSRN